MNFQTMIPGPLFYWPITNQGIYSKLIVKLGKLLFSFGELTCSRTFKCVLRKMKIILHSFSILSTAKLFKLK